MPDPPVNATALRANPLHPCPTASCSRMPGQPGPSTTVRSPRGRGHCVQLYNRRTRQAPRAKYPASSRKFEAHASSSTRAAVEHRPPRRHVHPRGGRVPSLVATARGAGYLRMSPALERLAGRKPARQRAHPHPVQPRRPGSYPKGPSTPDTGFACDASKPAFSKIWPDPWQCTPRQPRGLRISPG